MTFLKFFPSGRETLEAFRGKRIIKYHEIPIISPPPKNISPPEKSAPPKKKKKKKNFQTQISV